MTISLVLILFCSVTAYELPVIIIALNTNCIVRNMQIRGLEAYKNNLLNFSFLEDENKFF